MTMDTTTGEVTGQIGVSKSPIDAFGMAVVAIGIFGVVGNGLTLLVFVRAKKFTKSSGGVLIIIQTSTDLFCSCILIITHGYKSNPMQHYTQGIEDVLCFLIHGEVLLYIGLTASIYNLVIITVERYVMVVHPIRHRTSFSRKKIALITLLSWVMASLHPIFANLMSTYINGQGMCMVYQWGQRKGIEAAQTVYFIHTYVLPIATFVFVYSKIWSIQVRKKQQVTPMATRSIAMATVSQSVEQSSQSPNSSASSPTKLTRKQVNFTKTVIMLTMAFVVLWMPVEIGTMLLNFGIYGTFLNFRTYKIALALSFSNCVVNPIIYAFQMENFKKAFVKYVCPYKCSCVEVTPGAIGGLGPTTLYVGNSVQPS